jgi:hypothetical protein
VQPSIRWKHYRERLHSSRTGAGVVEKSRTARHERFEKERADLLIRELRLRNRFGMALVLCVTALLILASGSLFIAVKEKKRADSAAKQVEEMLKETSKQ